jgi:hypothetical protein
LKKNNQLSNIKSIQEHRDVNINQSGGVRIIPEYRDAKITPFKTNQQLNIEYKNKEEKENLQNNINLKKAQNADPYLELKINHPQTQQQIPQSNQIYPSAYVPIPNPYYPLATNGSIPWQYTPNTVPIIKRYNISLGNGNGDITKLANLYEDILPSEGNVSNNTFNTLRERLIIHHYIRSIFIITGDGEELLINGGPNNTKSELTNLLSHVKLLEINPYHFNRLNNNPYTTLPTNFVMYRSCYPIKMGTNNLVECSVSSIGINVRIYLLSKLDNDIYKKEKDYRYKSDIWRELDYYQYIREEIIKPNISPNFITIHSYYLTKNTGINFRKFDSIKGQKQIKNYNVAQSNSEIRNKLYEDHIINQLIIDTTYIISFEDLITYKIIENNIKKRNVTDIERKNCIEKKIRKLIIQGRYNHAMDSDNCLVILSEAPTQHILNWATRTYQEDNGPIKKMINNGYHHDRVWESLFFQLLLSMLIMFEKKIMFTEFSLENNVYIKDLRHNDNNIGIWKYIYNGIEYYVPNYGYLLVIDSKYAELEKNPDILNLTKKKDIIYQIKSTIFTDKISEIYYLCLEKMRGVFSNNNFTGSFIKYGGVAPTSQFLIKLEFICDKLKTIQNKYFDTKYIELSSDNIVKLINDIKNIPIELTINNIYNMVHSRIGMVIKDQEKSLISEDFDINTKYGSIVVRKNTNNISTFAIYLGSTINIMPVKYKILSSDNPIFTIEDKVETSKYLREKTLDRGFLYNFTGKPEQIYEPGKQFNILETYLISLAKN